MLEKEVVVGNDTTIITIAQISIYEFTEYHFYQKRRQNEAAEIKSWLIGKELQSK